MPKKTRKQKLRSTQLRTSLTLPDKENLDLQEKIKSHTVTDLRKTVLLTLALFALEFLIFYANLK